MRSKAADFKHRWSAAKSRVPKGFYGVFSGSCGHVPEANAKEVELAF
jgi:hypothetical protein